MANNSNELTDVGNYLVRLSGTSSLLVVPVYLVALIVRASFVETIVSVGVIVVMSGILLVAGCVLRLIARRVDRPKGPRGGTVKPGDAWKRQRNRSDDR